MILVAVIFMIFVIVVACISILSIHDDYDEGYINGWNDAMEVRGMDNEKRRHTSD